MDKLSFIGAPEGVTEPVAAQEPTETAAAEPTGQARGPDGKFLAREPDPAPAEAAPPETQPHPDVAPAAQPDAAAQPPAQPDSRPDPTHVPLAAMLDERDKRQATEKRAKELEDRLKAIEEQQRQPPPAAPDRYEDPEGYDAYQAQQLESRLFNERANFSERFARKEHGDDIVNAAQVWAKGRIDADPGFNQRIRAEADPYDYVIREYQRDQVASNMTPADYKAFQEWRAAQATGSTSQPSAAAPYTPPPPPSAPPRSIASQPSAGGSKPGETPVGPGVAFDKLFK